MTRKRQLREQISELMLERDDLKVRLANTGKRCNEIAADRDELARQVKDRGEELAELGRKIRALDLALATAGTRADAAEQDRDTARAHAAEMDRQVAGAIAERDHLLSERTILADLTDQLNEAQETLAERDEDLADVRAIAAAAEQRLHLARRALTADGHFTMDEVGDDIAPRITERVTALAARVRDLEAEVARVRAEPGGVRLADLMPKPNPVPPALAEPAADGSESAPKRPAATRTGKTTRKRADARRDADGGA